MSSLEQCERALESAQKSGNEEAVATALVALSARLLEEGQVLAARERLDTAAGLHETAGRAAACSHCLQQAATVSRLAGDLKGAEERALSAEACAGAEVVLAAAAAAELAEIATLQARFEIAAEHFQRALSHGEEISPLTRAELHRRCARSLAGAGDLLGAQARWKQSAMLYEELGDEAAAIRVVLEHATMLVSRDDAGAADALIESLVARSKSLGDGAISAELNLLRAQRALSAGENEKAKPLALQAKEQALASRSELAYVAACHLLADLHHRAGERASAYGVLATGWVTLISALGEEAAKAAFAPRLEEYRQAWGDTNFSAARSEFEAAQTSDST